MLNTQHDICMLAFRLSKLDSFELLDARIKSRDLSRDCQLTFEWYCTPLNEGAILLGFFFSLSSLTNIHRLLKEQHLIEKNSVTVRVHLY